MLMSASRRDPWPTWLIAPGRGFLGMVSGRAADIFVGFYLATNRLSETSDRSNRCHRCSGSNFLLLTTAPYFRVNSDSPVHSLASWRTDQTIQRRGIDE